MPRHKSRGRRSHKGRAGTRKQAGGFDWPWANKDPAAAVPADPNAVAAPPPATPAPAPGTEAESKSWWSKINPFKSKPADTNATNKPVDPNAALPDKKWWHLWGGGSRRKSRKTRHRQRRHHRK